MIPALLAVIALVLSLYATRWLQGSGSRRVTMLDHPGSRSLHAAPTPRTGGLAIAVGVLPAFIYVAFAGDLDLRLVLLGWVLVFAVSVLDDARDVPFWIRLPVHLLAASCVVMAPGFPQVPAAQVLAVFWIVWGTNLFNFMDGMDGLAGSMATLGGLFLAAALALSGAGLPAVVAGVAALAAAGFLRFNWPPARIFMGDAGSASLGFLFSALSVMAVGEDVLPAWLPLLVFLPFVADATFTLVRRGWQRKPVWKAHREHLYQARVLAGQPVRQVLVAAILAMLACGGAAIALLVFRPAGGWAALAVLAALSLTVYCCMITSRE